MKPRLPLRTLAGALAFASTLAHAELYIIANPGTAISAADIKDIFTGQKQFSGPVKLTPVDNAAAQEVFLANALRMDPGRYNTIWTKKSFREGLNPPYVKTGDAEVLEFVRKTPGGIGYVSSAPPGSVTIVNIIHEF
jgi:ABC-type phosphate transport system substrate-binding protein